MLDNECWHHLGRVLEWLKSAKSLGKFLVSTMAFKIASKFQEAARTINNVAVDKFPLLLNRILQKLHLKVLCDVVTYCMILGDNPLTVISHIDCAILHR